MVQQRASASELTCIQTQVKVDLCKSAGLLVTDDIPETIAGHDNQSVFIRCSQPRHIGLTLNEPAYVPHLHWVLQRH